VWTIIFIGYSSSFLNTDLYTSGGGFSSIQQDKWLGERMLLVKHSRRGHTNGTIMDEIAKKLAGKFIVLDGPDGSGKSTQIAMLADLLAAQGAEVVTVCDPGGTEVGEKIRSVLLDRETGSVSPMCEMLLFMASRAQLVAERIRPALEAGKTVLCDRFISATIAYQGAVGIDHGTIIELGETATGGLWPDLTIILDVPVETGMERISAGRSCPGDRMETKGSAFHKSVRRIFKELAEYYRRPVEYVNAEKDADEVFAETLSVLERIFPIKNA
jgi:dTMP kinase